MKVAAAGLVALSAGACSFSFGVAGMEVEEPLVTGAIASTATNPLSPDLTDEDWRRAKAALGLALDPQGPGTQVSWDNPATAMKGAFTPTGAPFVKDDEICRTFSAQFSGPSTASLQGTACRPSGDEWAVKEIAPAGTEGKGLKTGPKV